MTNYFTRKGNRIIKFAYVEAIFDLLTKHHITSLYMDEGFENDTQMIHFIYGGRKVKLIAVKLPSKNFDKLILIVEWKKTRWEIPIPVAEIKIQTLQKITYEVYDWLRNEEDEDWDFFEKKLISENLDTYM